MIKNIMITFIIITLFTGIALADVNTTGPLSNGQYTDISTLHLELLTGLIALIISLWIATGELSPMSCITSVLLNGYSVYIFYFGSLQYISGNLISTDAIGQSQVIRNGGMSTFIFMIALIIFMVFLFQCYQTFKVMTYEEPKNEKYYYEED